MNLSSSPKGGSEKVQSLRGALFLRSHSDLSHHHAQPLHPVDTTSPLCSRSLLTFFSYFASNWNATCEGCEVGKVVITEQLSLVYDNQSVGDGMGGSTVSLYARLRSSGMCVATREGCLDITIPSTLGLHSFLPIHKADTLSPPSIIDKGLIVNCGTTSENIIISFDSRDADYLPFSSSPLLAPRRYMRRDTPYCEYNSGIIKRDFSTGRCNRRSGWRGYSTAAERKHQADPGHHVELRPKGEADRRRQRAGGYQLQHGAVPDT